MIVKVNTIDLVLGADAVSSDTILNPNVVYEPGARHPVRPQWAVLISAGVGWLGSIVEALETRAKR